MGPEIASGTYTIMFTDMVDSTRVRVSIGETAADELRRVHDDLLTEAIEAQDGRVVKTAGDGVMAAFRTCHQSIDAAVGIQQAVARYRRRPDALAPIQIRIGLSVGDVSVEDGDLFGTPVVEAARLESLASAGSILCSDLVRLLAGGRTDADFVDRGSVELKGLPDPVHHCEIAWVPDDGPSAAVPLPAHLEQRSGWPMVGRAQELGVLESAWKSVRAEPPRRRVAMIAGEPGIGKTRLSSEFAQQVADDGGIVLFGRCSEGFADPYQPFAEALRPAPVLELLRSADPTDLADLRALLPELGGDRSSAAATPSDADRPRLFRSVLSALDHLAAPAGLVLVLDDLQWAEASTLALLRRVCDDSLESRLVVLGTYRDSEVVRGEALANLLADLRRTEGFDRIKLNGLADTDVLDLARARGATELDDAAVELIHSIRHEANGSPLYVTEMFRSLAETGVIELREGRWVATAALEDIELPENVRDVIDRRVARLDPDVVDTLTIASVAGQHFDLEVLSAVSRLDGDTILDRLEEAIAARIVTESGGSGTFSFTHALVQRSLYENLSVTRRGRMHDQVREALAARSSSVQEQAHHAYLAHTSIDQVGTAELLLQSGEADERALAWEAGSIKYGRGLDVLASVAGDHLDLLARLHLGMARTLRRSETADPRPHLVAGADAARRAGRTDLLAEFATATLRPGWWFPEAGVVDRDHVALCEEVLDALPADDPRRCQVLGTLASALSFDPDRDRRVGLLDEADAIAREADDPALRHVIMSNRWVALWDPRSTIDRLPLAEQLWASARERDNIEGQAQAAICRLHCLLELGRANEFRHHLTEIGGLLDRAQIPYFTWIVQMMHDVLGVLEDRPGIDDELATTLASAGGSHADAEQAYGGALFGLYYAREETAALEPFLEIQANSQPDFVVWRAGWGASLAAAGRLDEALTVYDEFRAVDFEVPMNFVWTIGMFAIIDMAVALGDSDGARAGYRQLLPFSGRLECGAGVLTLGPIDLALARAALALDNRDAAEMHALAGRELAESFRARHYVARADRILGELS